MKLNGNFRFAGVECRHGFKDPNQEFYILGLLQGMDMLRLYIDKPLYEQLVGLEPYSEVVAELDYNPVADKNQMRLVSII